MRNRFADILIRYSTATAGLAVMSLSVALSIKSNIGTSPISCPPYVLNLCGGLSVGAYTALMHLCFIVLQIVLLRKSFKPSSLMQIPAAVVFGALMDGAIYLTDWIVPACYAARIGLMALSILLMALGISIEVRSRAWMIAGEMTVAAIAQVSGAKFRNVKIIFDCSLVALTVVFSLCVFGNPFGDGVSSVVREGTLAMALFVGLTMRLTDPLADRLLRRIIPDE